MGMKNIEIRSRDDIRAAMQKALKDNDAEGYVAAVDELVQRVSEDVKQEYEQRIGEMQQELDARVLTSRGVRQLTSAERSYYQRIIEALKTDNPKQAIGNLDVVMPETVINSVFDDLRTNHPLLSKIRFMATAGAIKMLFNTNGHQEAVWGPLCDEIIKEASSGFVEVDVTLKKLSAFVGVCKAMLDLGPEWLDRFTREVLYEMYANGAEAGIVTGDGNNKPIGMIRQVGDGVTVTGGVYPVKAKIKVSDLSPDTVGNLLSLIAVDPNGKSRNVRDVIFLVNPQDYFQKVMPATTLMAPDGSYRNDVMPYPMTIIPVPALDRGDAVMGIAYRYFGAAGTSRQGRIEYSDHARFLEDQRVYIIKGYMNGLPMDNNAFLYLDISGLRPAVWKVEQVTPSALSADATLADIKIGGLSLTPTFAAATTTYAVTTANAKNTITAFPADAGAEIEVKVGEDEIDNGTAYAWKSGENTVTINVTAADGTTTKSYTVTVTANAS